MKITICYLMLALACLLFAAQVQGQDLFVCDPTAGNIYEFTTNGTRSTFASGLYEPLGLAFNSARDLFVANGNGDEIREFTPEGTSSYFAGFGAVELCYLAFDSMGNLFVSASDGSIYKVTPGRIQSTFASGLAGATPLAFSSAGNLFASSGGIIYEFSPSGARTTFSSGFTSMAFNSAGYLFAVGGNSIAKCLSQNLGAAIGDDRASKVK